MASSPKAPEKTAEQIAVEKRQRGLLNDEIEESEERLKALSRGTLGRASLLSGAPASKADAVGGGQRGGSMLGGGLGGAPSATPTGGGSSTTKGKTGSRIIP